MHELLYMQQMYIYQFVRIGHILRFTFFIHRVRPRSFCSRLRRRRSVRRVPEVGESQLPKRTRGST